MDFEKTSSKFGSTTLSGSFTLRLSFSVNLVTFLESFSAADTSQTELRG